MPIWIVRPAGKASALYESDRGRSPSGQLRAPLYLGIFMELERAEQIAREHNAHAALVEACQTLLAAENLPPWDRDAALLVATEKARDALALMGEPHAG